MRFARMQLDGDLAAHALIDAGIDLHQSFEADVLRKKDLAFSCGAAIAVSTLNKPPKAKAPAVSAPPFRKLRRENCSAIL